MNRLALIAIAVLASARIASAETAAELFKQATDKYEKGEYRAAVKLFDDAYALVHDPVYLFNIAQAYRKLFDCVPSSQYFKRYLAEATDADVAQRKKVQQWIDELAPCVRERETVVVKPKPLPIEPPKPPPIAPVIDNGRGFRIAGLTLVGTGAVAVVVGSLFGKRGNDIQADLDAECTMGCAWTADRERRDHDGARANLIAGIGWVAGGAAIAGGAVLYVVGRSRRGERITVVPTTTGAVVSARFSY